MLIGYARVSSTGQSLDIQTDALTGAGCEKIHAEKRSGRTAKDRPDLIRALDQLRPGDTLIVTRLDRLARSVGDLRRVIEQIGVAGAAFRCLQQGGVDTTTTTSTGKLMLAILGAVAEFENDIRRKRQRDGIEKAKENGVYQGRPAKINGADVARLAREGHGPSAIARRQRLLALPSKEHPVSASILTHVGSRRLKPAVNPLGRRGLLWL